MKAVLLSTQPEWCEQITSGKKKDEIRKTKPKIETPFTVYLYCTQGEALDVPSLNNPIYAIHRTNNGTQKGKRMTAEERQKSDHQFANGKVIGEFVCDKFTFLDAYYDSNGNRHLCNTAFIKSCVRDDELFDYLYGKHGRKHGGWAWHISDLKIYDEPKDLNEFYPYCEGECTGCKYLEWIEMYGSDACTKKRIKRPPQSWCYVEQLQNEYSGGRHE